MYWYYNETLCLSHSWKQKSWWFWWSSFQILPALRSFCLFAGIGTLDFLCLVFFVFVVGFFFFALFCFCCFRLFLFFTRATKSDYPPLYIFSYCRYFSRLCTSGHYVYSLLSSGCQKVKCSLVHNDGNMVHVTRLLLLQFAWRLDQSGKFYVFCYEVIFLRQYSFCVNDEVQIFGRGKLSLEIAGLTHVPRELFCESSDGSKQKLPRKVEILFQAKFLRKFGIESVGMCRWIFALLLHNNVCPSIWLFFCYLNVTLWVSFATFFSNSFAQLCTGKIRIEMAAAVVSSWEMITQKVSVAKEISCRNLWTNILHELYCHFQER